MTRVAVIGAGIGGLTAAILLATRGLDVTLFERQSTPGGKMRQLTVGGAQIDAGPTVLTMPQVFEELFDDVGDTLADHLTLTRAGILARHAWADARLDLHADPAMSADAIADFAGSAEARAYLDFAARAARIWQTLEPTFIRAQRPTVAGLTARAGPAAMFGISPFTTLSRALAQHFRDPRLRQLFGRYATYCGSSPHESPATLMLVAHLESQGVWRVAGGMHALAQALAALATRQGVAIRYNSDITSIRHANRVTAVTLDGLHEFQVDRVICADAGTAARLTRAVRPTPVRDRSFSAVTWAMHVQTAGFPLLHHNVFFSPDDHHEFEDLRAGRLHATPTVYVCAQDRADTPEAHERERLLVLVNAPPAGDAGHLTETELAQCRDRTLRQLQSSGLTLHAPQSLTTTPTDWNNLFPMTGGALYGANAHGWAAAFRRPQARTSLPGLYLAGGSTHPGPGVPMAALSGRLAASALIEDLASTARSRRTAMSGGTSTRSATTARTASP